MTHFPTTIASHIATFLNEKSHSRLKKACQYWYRICQLPTSAPEAVSYECQYKTSTFVCYNSVIWDQVKIFLRYINNEADVKNTNKTKEETEAEAEAEKNDSNKEEEEEEGKEEVKEENAVDKKHEAMEDEEKKKDESKEEKQDTKEAYRSAVKVDMAHKLALHHDDLDALNKVAAAVKLNTVIQKDVHHQQSFETKDEYDTVDIKIYQLEALQQRLEKLIKYAKLRVTATKQLQEVARTWYYSQLKYAKSWRIESTDAEHFILLLTHLAPSHFERVTSLNLLDACLLYMPSADIAAKFINLEHLVIFELIEPLHLLVKLRTLTVGYSDSRRNRDRHASLAPRLNNSLFPETLESLHYHKHLNWYHLPFYIDQFPATLTHLTLRAPFNSKNREVFWHLLLKMKSLVSLNVSTALVENSFFWSKQPSLSSSLSLSSSSSSSSLSSLENKSSSTNSSAEETTKLENYVWPRTLKRLALSFPVMMKDNNRDTDAAFLYATQILQCLPLTLESLTLDPTYLSDTHEKIIPPLLSFDYTKKWSRFSEFECLDHLEVTPSKLSMQFWNHVFQLPNLHATLTSISFTSFESDTTDDDDDFCANFLSGKFLKLKQIALDSEILVKLLIYLEKVAGGSTIENATPTETDTHTKTEPEIETKTPTPTTEEHKRGGISSFSSSSFSSSSSSSSSLACLPSSSYSSSSNLTSSALASSSNHNNTLLFLLSSSSLSSCSTSSNSSSTLSSLDINIVPMHSMHNIETLNLHTDRVDETLDDTNILNGLIPPFPLLFAHLFTNLRKLNLKRWTRFWAAVVPQLVHLRYINLSTSIDIIESDIHLFASIPHLTVCISNCEKEIGTNLPVNMIVL